MEDQLISFETAKLAKEKGFELNSICYFQLLQNRPLRYMLVVEEGEGDYVNEDPENRIAVCTQSLLQRWLRETHLLFVYITPKWEGDNKKDTRWRHNNSYESAKTLYNTYEEALEAGLIEALNYIK